MKRVIVLIALSSSFAAIDARAENRRPLALGGRTGSMGGAGVAFGNDAAMALLNPAGLARVPNNVLSLSLSAYSLDVYRYDRFFAQADPPSFMGMFDIEGNVLRSSTFNSVPASLSYVIHLGDDPRHVLAISVLLPNAERRELGGILRLSNAFFTANSGFSSVRTERTYFAGPSYAIAFGDESARLHLGASLFVVRSERSLAIETNDIAGAVPARDFQAIRSSLFQTAESFDLTANIGAQLELGGFSLGVALQAPSVHVAGSFELTGRITRLGNGVLDTADTIEERQGKGDFLEQQPLRVTAGVGLALGALTVGADFGVIAPAGSFRRFDGSSRVSTLVEATDPVNREEELIVETREKLAFHGAAGVEYLVSPTLSFRAGGFFETSTTDLDDLARVSLGTERIDRFGGTFGVGLDLGGAETSLAFEYVGGLGEVIGLDTGNFENAELFRSVDAVQSTFGVLISGSVDIQSMFGG